MNAVAGLSPIDLLVLQPTPYCNIDCSYCYLPSRTDRRSMPHHLLDAIFAKVLPSRHLSDRLTVVWHAGEPLALPIAWYVDAFARAAAFAPPGLQIRHAIQTNGIGLDARWAELLRAHAVSVGLSLDGPADLHDARRRTRGGSGTHALAIRAVKTLHDAGLPFHVISVITAAHLDHADRLFDFYCAHGIREVGFNIEEVEGANRRSSLAGVAAEARFRAFLRRFIERVADSAGQVSLRELTHAATAIAVGGLEARDENQPLRIVSIDVAGHVSTFSPELLGCHSTAHDNFVVGDILAEPFEAIAARAAASRMAGEIARGVAACRAACAYFEFCGGGAPANKWFELGRFDGTETAFCRMTRKIVVDEVLRALEMRLNLRPSLERAR
jgi:uncharacterized protein